MTARLPDTIASAESALMPDTAAAVDFLQCWAPDGPWVLTSIVPDGKADTATFAAGETERLTRWIDERQGIQNVYFQVNPARRHLTSKASKADVAALAWLHVDIDPREGEDPAAGKARALAVLRGHPNPPSVTIDSGSGLQAFWKVAEPLPLLGDTDEARVAHAEAQLEPYNIALAREFGADHCHNVDRIMRLPGTVNIPNRKKLKKGRQRALAQLIEFEPSRVYSIEDFERAEPVRAQAAGASVGHAQRRGPARGTASPRAAAVDVDALRAWAAANGKTIREDTLALIATGDDPIRPGRYPSRSEPLMRVCCDLVRADVDRDIIFRVITGPNKIGESVGERPDWHAYAWRQIERAEEEAIAPELLEMNDRHFVVTNYMGKTRVMLLTFDAEMERDRLVAQTREDITLAYANRQVVVGTKKDGSPDRAPLAAWWLAHPARRQFQSIYFHPGKKGAGHDKPGHYNLWRGFGVNPKAGDWSLMREHVRRVLASGVEEYADYILRWAAWTVQNPAEPAEAALVFRGGKGTGKGTFARALKMIFGQHGMQVSSPTQVTGKFNSHLRDCCLLFADEAIRPGREGGEGQLKVMITEPTLAVEAKGKDIVEVPNRLHIVMASNEDYVVPATGDERRFAVFDVPTLFKPGDASKAYFTPLYEQMASGGLAAMLFDLLAMDLGSWHPRWNIPATKALADQQRKHLSGIDAVVFDLLSVDGWGPLMRQTAKGRFVATEALRRYASDWLAQHDREPRHVSAHDIKSLMPLLDCSKYRIGGGGDNGYLLPSTQQMRQRWNEVRFRWWDESATAEPEPDDVEPEQGAVDAEPEHEDEKSPF